MYIMQSCHAILDLQYNFRPGKYYAITNDERIHRKIAMPRLEK